MHDILSSKSLEIIKEYISTTGQSPEWISTLPLEDYLKVRERAAEEIRGGFNKITQQTTENDILPPSSKQQPAPQTLKPEHSHTGSLREVLKAEAKPEPKAETKAEKKEKELTELDLFKTLKD